MEFKSLIYKIKNKEDLDKDPCYEAAICKLSPKNIIAFCIASREKGHDISIQRAICACDLLTPSHIYKVCLTNNAIQALEWNLTGELLLVAEGGLIRLWKCQNFEINSWELAFVVNSHCENIISCEFFQSGNKIIFNRHRRDSPIYTDKFERAKSSASLQSFGKVAAEGCILLTSSGFVSIFSIPHIYKKIIKDSSIQPRVDLAGHSLGLTRSYVESSALLYCNNGSFRIATCASQEKLVHCNEINVESHIDGNLVISRKSLPCIFLNDGHEDNFKISHIKWTVIEKEDIVLLAYNCDQSFIVEQWNLRSKSKSIHKFLHKNKTDTLQCELWENMARYHLPIRLTDICLSKSVLDTQFIYLLLKDNSIQIFESGLKRVGTCNLQQFLDEDHKCDSFLAIDISIMNHVLISLNSSGDLYVVQVFNRYIDMKPSDILTLEISLLEYCIISGIDASDILLLHISNLESLIEKLSENFMRQPPFIRQYYYSKFLTLKSNMCRMICKQNDFDNLIMLHSISIAFKSLLRPSDLSCYEKSPADNLSIVLSEAVPDVDKVLFNLDAKDFTVEPITLQSLQRLIQWVADLAHNILNKLPEDCLKNKFCKKQCYEISKDLVALNSIRELLAMIRIWGLLNCQCLPNYSKSSEGIDILALLFRLLTRLTQNPTEPDELLIDECVTLSNQILLSDLNFSGNITLLNGSIVTIKSFPLVLTRSIESIYQMQDIPIERVMYSAGRKDDISNIIIGNRFSRECIRCGCFKECNVTAKTSAIKAWYYRYMNCRCGGFWRKISDT